MKRGRWASAVLVLAFGCGDNKTTTSDSGPAVTVTAELTASATVSSPPAPTSVVTPKRVTPALPEEDLVAKTLTEQREAMLRRMKLILRLDDAQLAAVQKVYAKSKIISQANPEVSEYAMTRKECRERREAAKVVEEEDDVCGAPFMSPIFNVKAGETRDQARVCVDRYEFPGIPCEYPVTWISAREAALTCKAIGKRLCDAHEWEGACAGSLLPAESEYTFNKPRKESKTRHNREREIVWAYGAAKDFSKCAMGSKKSKKCEKSGWKVCGSNTYPAGSFPECRSSFGVYDQHGNVAEHMNLPIRKADLGSAGGAGETEMKGSWFIFQTYEAHEDDCRWRAPDWHGTKLMSFDSHQNYHLGFRCCKDVEPPKK